MTLKAQRRRALDAIEGVKPARKPRLVKQSKTSYKFDEKAFNRAEKLVGLKGYVTNIPATFMPASEIISSYHELWHVEQSFRMSKTDLRACPIFHRQKDAIEAHLTIVMTALAISRYLYQKNRNNHQKTRPHPTTSTRSHHKPTRKPTNHSSTKNQPPNPENPGQTGSLNLCNSGVTIRLTMRVCLTGFMLSSRAYRRLGHILNWML